MTRQFEIKCSYIWSHLWHSLELQASCRNPGTRDLTPGLFWMRPSRRSSHQNSTDANRAIHRPPVI